MFEIHGHKGHREHIKHEHGDNPCGEHYGEQGHDDRNQGLICPLTMAPVGKDLRLCQLCRGRRVARRLAELGLTPGVKLRIVQDAGGPLLVSVRNSRVALGRGIADKLTVEVLDTDAAGPENTAKPHFRSVT